MCRVSDESKISRNLYKIRCCQDRIINFKHIFGMLDSVASSNKYIFVRAPSRCFDVWLLFGGWFPVGVLWRGGRCLVGLVLRHYRN